MKYEAEENTLILHSRVSAFIFKQHHHHYAVSSGSRLSKKIHLTKINLDWAHIFVPNKNEMILKLMQSRSE